MHRSPLHDSNAALGARFVDFAGWDMPVQYEGVIAEHKAVRSACGVFDVSHLGRFQLTGPGATALLRTLLCNDVNRIDPGRAQYTMALNEAGGVIDDIIVWRRDAEDYWVLPNGANYDRVVARFQEHGSDEVTVTPRRHDTALVAVQGPEAPGVLDRVLGEAPKRFRLSEAEFDGTRVIAAGTGYTGERGGELVVAAAAAPALLQALIDAGATPCGLGSRDTLRLEMGFPLWGQDLDDETSPLEAGLEWVVDWDHDFIGKAALEQQRDGGLSKRLVAFMTVGRAIPRHGYALRAGVASGYVASGNYSPILERGIGMGYLAPPVAVDTVDVEIRGSWVPAAIAETPFIGKG